jgi:hypothetical protein
METLLIVAVVLTALAIIVQAGILASMYLLSRRLSTRAERLMDDSRRLMPPVEAITGNLKTITNDLTETGKLVRGELANIQQSVADMRALLLDTVGEARTVVMRPVRQYSAIALAVAEGFKTLFSSRETDVTETEEIQIRDKHPAA